MKKSIVLLALCGLIASIDAMYSNKPMIDTTRLGLTAPSYDFSKSSLQKPVLSQPLKYDLTLVPPKTGAFSTNPYSLTNGSGNKAQGLASLVNPAKANPAAATKSPEKPKLKEAVVLKTTLTSGSPTSSAGLNLRPYDRKPIAVAKPASRAAYEQAQKTTLKRELADELAAGVTEGKNAVDTFKKQVEKVVTEEINELKKEMRKEISGMIVYTMRVVLPGLIKEAINGILYGASALGSGVKNMFVGSPKKIASDRSEEGFFRDDAPEVDLVV